MARRCSCPPGENDLHGSHASGSLHPQCRNGGSPGVSTSNRAVFALNEMLKQQLAMTRRLMESRHPLHSSLVQSLGPANYRYTTLEDTKEYIRIHRRPKLKMEEALEELLQEMRDHRPL
uniref:uncharacterized protein C19orf44 homolog n=1 Tax=Gasterosteus aculeatus aculeatus TaxID=481459 RepID=UPI001A98D79C|nr:uncharacterized protein C19orf44 homolog [Gasterosteus aculeatus aculeatus]